MEKEQIKYFLETMPNLEQVIKYYNTATDEDVIEISTQLQMLVSKVASSKCVVQMVSSSLGIPFRFKDYPPFVSVKINKTLVVSQLVFVKMMFSCFGTILF